jgi:hypothetical protein
MMQGVDTAISQLGGTGVVGQVVGAVNMSTTAYEDAQMLGSYAAPLGQVLQSIVKIMDSVADVSRRR